MQWLQSPGGESISLDQETSTLYLQWHEFQILSDEYLINLSLGQEKFVGVSGGYAARNTHKSLSPFH